MATRSLVMRMWTPAASALRRRSGPTSASASVYPRLVDNIHSQAEHRSTGVPKSAVDNESLSEELYKVGMLLGERKVELDNVHAEMKSVVKRCVVAIVGLPLLAWVLKTY